MQIIFNRNKKPAKDKVMVRSINIRASIQEWTK